MMVETTRPIRSPFTPVAAGKAPDNAPPAAPPPDVAPEPDDRKVEGRSASAALIGLLLPAALLPIPSTAEAPTGMSQSMPVRRQDEEDFSQGAITYPVSMPGPIEVRELEPLPPAYVRGDDGSLPAVRLPDHPGPHYIETVPLVDRMLEPDLPEAWRNDLRRDLGVLPAPVLRKLNEADMRIWVVPDGVTEAPARMFKADAPTEGERFEYKGRFYSKRTFDDIADLNKRLAEHTIDGLFMPSQHVIAIREVTLRDPASGQGKHRVALHEIAHAVDYLAGLDATHGQTHRETLDKIHAEVSARGPQAFITSYARTNATEHYADGFEAYFTVDRTDSTRAGATLPVGENEDEATTHLRQLDSSYDDLKQREPALLNLIEQDMQNWIRAEPAARPPRR